MNRRFLSILLCLALLAALAPAGLIRAGAVTTILTVEIDELVEPQAGAHSTSVSVAADAPYELVKCMWNNSTTHQWMEAGAAFDGGSKFYAYIELKPKEGYAFPTKAPALTSVTINGKKELFSHGTERYGDGTMGFYTTDMTTDSKITSVAVTGLVEPEEGNLPESVSVDPDAPYEISGCTWGNDTKHQWLHDGETFEGGFSYYALIELTPKAGCQFPEKYANLSSVTIDGGTALIDRGLKFGDGSIGIYTVAMAAPKKVRSVDVSGIPKPETGKHPTTTAKVPADAPYVINSIAWYNETDGMNMDPSETFEKDKEYCARIDLNPKSGYVFPAQFSDLESATINGGTADLDASACTIFGSANMTMYTVTYTAGDHVHTYEAPTWTWAEDMGSAKAKFTCLAGDDTAVKDAAVTSEVKTAAGCETAGIRSYTASVSMGGNTFTDTREAPIPAAGHTLVKTDAKTPTCKENGSSAYYTCSVCGKYFSDAAGTAEISAYSWVLPAAAHTLVKTPAKAPTATAPGNKEYYTCSVCGLYFSDAAGSIEIEKDSWILPAVPGTPEDPGTPDTPTDPARPFVDVQNPKAFYYDPVYWAYYHDPQITKGTDETHFSPDATCTRGQVVTFLWRAAGMPAAKTDVNPFTDVQKGKFYYDAVLWAVGEGITNGVSATEFGPDQGCTRGQVVTFLHRFEKTPAPGSAENPFSDVSSGAFYYDAVLWAVEKGVTNGTSPTTFAPGDTCTRGQIVTFLYRDLSK